MIWCRIESSFFWRRCASRWELEQWDQRRCVRPQFEQCSDEYEHEHWLSLRVFCRQTWGDSTGEGSLLFYYSKPLFLGINLRPPRHFGSIPGPTTGTFLPSGVRNENTKMR